MASTDVTPEGFLYDVPPTRAIPTSLEKTCADRALGRRTRHFFALQVFRRCIESSITGRTRLVRARTCLLCPIKGILGPLSLPKQHFYAS